MSNCKPRVTPPAEHARAIVEADKFLTGIAPHEGREYDWVSDYAKDVFTWARADYRDLEGKANEIIKYLGGGTGLFTLGVLANVRHDNRWIVLFVIPSFTAALTSIVLAARIRLTMRVDFPPDVKGAFEYADYYEGNGISRAAFIGQWHRACLSVHAAISAKARLLWYATWAFVAAIALLAVPLLAVFSMA